MTKVAISLHTLVAAYVCEPMHAYTEKHKKGKVSAIMAEVWNESHIIWEPF